MPNPIPRRIFSLLMFMAGVLVLGPAITIGLMLLTAGPQLNDLELNYPVIGAIMLFNAVGWIGWMFHLSKQVHPDAKER